VPDYDRWASVIKKAQRRRDGVISVSVFRSVDDPNEVMIDIELESADVAQDLLPSEEFRDVLDRSGIEIYPPVFLGHLVEDLSLPSDGSLMVVDSPWLVPRSTTSSMCRRGRRADRRGPRRQLAPPRPRSCRRERSPSS
jgi:hypothetical protein